MFYPGLWWISNFQFQLILPNFRSQYNYNVIKQPILQQQRQKKHVFCHYSLNNSALLRNSAFIISNFVLTLYSYGINNLAETIFMIRINIRTSANQKAYVPKA